MQQRHSPGQWTAKAESDLVAARDLMRVESDSLDAICFHSQQTAEKYLKALMALHGMDIPKTHSLPRLMGLLAEALPMERKLQEVAAWLSQFAVDTRYPVTAGMPITIDDANRALETANTIKDLCLQAMARRENTTT